MLRRMAFLAGEPPGEPGTFDFEIEITVDSDDAWEHQGTGAMNLDDTTFIINQNRLHGFRFPNAGLIIPPGSTISVANVKYKSTASWPDANTVTCFVQRAASPLTFTTSGGDISDRTFTTESSEWVIPAWTVNQQDADTTTPSLVDEFQELVDNEGINGAAVVMLRGDSSSGNRGLYGSTHTSGSKVAAILTLEGTFP